LLQDKFFEWKICSYPISFFEPILRLLSAYILKNSSGLWRPALGKKRTAECANFALGLKAPIPNYEQRPRFMIFEIGLGKFRRITPVEIPAKLLGGNWFAKVCKAVKLGVVAF